MSTHTPTPWQVEGYDKDSCEIIGPNEGHVAFCNESVSGRSNAEFIVRAANCHDELVAVVQRLVDGPHDSEAVADMLPDARAALAKAKGE